ncbi:MAG: caspase family protein, partial [Gemmatimonadales bacterium]
AVSMGAATAVSMGAATKEAAGPSARTAGFFSRSAESPAQKSIAHIALGETANGTLAASDEVLDDGEYVDFWTLSVPTGQTVDIQMRSTTFDTYLGLVAGTMGEPGEIMGTNDDADGSTNSRLQGHLAAGNYVIFATSYRAATTGAYALSVTGSGAAAGAGGQIQAGQTVSSQLSGSDPVLGDDSHYQLWSFRGNAGDQVIIRMESGRFDTFLHLLQGAGLAGETIATDDDGAGGTNSQIAIALPEAGTYTIVANSYAAGATGAYTLNLQQVNNDWAARFPGGGDPNGKYAVVVGIDDYPGTPNDLRGPIDDATLVRDVLIERFGFPAENVVFLRDGEGNRAAIANAIVRHLGQAGPDGTAVFFYSGHGMRLRENIGVTGRLDPETGNNVDEALAVWDGMILDEEMALLLQYIQARNQLVVIDACFSGTATRGGDAMPKFIAASEVDNIRKPTNFITNELGAGLGFGGGVRALEQALTRPDRHLLMAASSEDQLSWAIGRWPDRSGPASLYTYYWAKMARAVPLTTTFNQLHRVVSDSVNAFVSRNANIETQTAQIMGPNSNTSLGAFFRTR